MKVACAVVLFVALMGWDGVQAANVVVIGDSLSAEYEAIPDFPGTENPTEYARITVQGWEAMSWVEVLGRLRSNSFNFGGYKSNSSVWPDLRFFGYEFNFAIPGFQASQYEEIVTSSLFSSPFYLPFRSTIQDALKKADRAVIWLGANEIRGNYGFLAAGGNPTSLINGLIDDLTEIVEFVQKQRSGLEIVLVNLPDLGAAPSKRDSVTAAQRVVATAAIQRANSAIAQLAASKKVVLANVFAQTERLINGETTYFGAVNIINAAHPDNNPRYHFTREGLHPNTPSQIEIARVMIEAFNQGYGAGIPQITDAEALKLLGIDPYQPYADWIDTFKIAQRKMEDDPDQDGLPNLVEMAFGLDPAKPNRSPVTIGIERGQTKATFKFAPTFQRLAKILPEQSFDLFAWNPLSADSVVTTGDLTTLTLPIAKSRGFLRLKIFLIPP